MHLFCGAIDVDAHTNQVREAQSARSPERSSVSDLTQRVSVLEAEVAELQAELQKVLESLR
jgi:uncharacterized protein YceH (UPF0502 family)